MLLQAPLSWMEMETFQWKKKWTMQILQFVYQTATNQTEMKQKTKKSSNFKQIFFV